MSTFEKCPKSVNQMAKEILERFESHKPLINAAVTTDFVFAYAEKDEKTGEPKGDALKLHGVKALAICRKMGLKDRVMGRADTEISIDGDWWPTASDEEQRALLDHELHHILVKVDKRGLVRDDIGRPIIHLRPHDVQIGWFKIIAERHKLNSQECKQAVQIMCESGQYFWPGLSKIVESNPKLLTE
jgi:hypothetical protein